MHDSESPFWDLDAEERAAIYAIESGDEQRDYDEEAYNAALMREA
jgi:hypothetical protein